MDSGPYDGAGRVVAEMSFKDAEVNQKYDKQLKDDVMNDVAKSAPKEDVATASYSFAKTRGSSTANPQGGAAGQGGAGAGGNNRRDPVQRGPGGGKKHTPGHNRKSADSQKTADAERRAKLQEAKDARAAELQRKWDALPEETQKLLGGFEKFVQDQNKKQ